MPALNPFSRMGSTHSSSLGDEVIQEISDTTGFSSREIVKLNHRFEYVLTS